MSFRYARTILGYHGCSWEASEAILSGEAFKQSEAPVEWLGDGIYFWEYGYQRAWQWAHEKVKGQDTKPAVVGALIHLGNCFDLLDIRSTQALSVAYPAFARTLNEAGKALLRNVGKDDDRKARFLDCGVINFWMESAAEDGGDEYDTVRGVFQEGPPAFDGSMIRAASHIQVAVRNPKAILGVFRPTGPMSDYPSLF